MGRRAVPTSGVLEAIWIKRARRGPMDRRSRAKVRVNAGLVDNVDQGGTRQVTIIEREIWDRLPLVGINVDPSARRANLMVSGIGLAESRGRVLRIGECRIHIRGETRPCNRMEEAHVGLRDALSPGWNGGAYGVIMDDGEIAVGDRVEWVEEEP